MSTPHLTTETGNNEWYTPPDIIEAARACMGGIDLDPASCDAAQKIVRAKNYYTIADDGLTQEWRGRVWLNPPYDRVNLPKFIKKLHREFLAGRTTEALVLVNNITETAVGQSLILHSPHMCFFKGRIAFIGPDGKPVRNNPRGQILFYYHHNPRRIEYPVNFYHAFNAFGQCR